MIYLPSKCVYWSILPVYILHWYTKYIYFNREWTLLLKGAPYLGLLLPLCTHLTWQESKIAHFPKCGAITLKQSRLLPSGSCHLTRCEKKPSWNENISFSLSWFLFRRLYMTNKVLLLSVALIKTSSVTMRMSRRGRQILVLIKDNNHWSGPSNCVVLLRMFW